MNSDILRALPVLLALVCTGSGWFGPSSSVLGRQRCAAQSAHDDAAYKELVEQALSEFKHKNWPEARVLFMRAHELNPNARTLRGMGIVSFEMRDYLNAVTNLKAALEDKRQALTDAQRKECESLLTRARTYVGVYTIKVDPMDARVQLDGAEVTRDEEGHLLVPFGEHTISARAPGRQEASTRLHVQGGERGDIVLALPLEAPAVLPVVAPAAAATAPEPSAAPASEPARGAKSERNGFVGHGLKYTWVALGASALFGGGAVAFWYLGDNELSKLDDKCRARANDGDPCTKGNTDTGKVELYETLTNVSIGVSAAALVTAGILMGLEWPRERRVAFGVGDRSLFVRGAF
ncbi:MAG TPA: hypothetical protein VFZ61_29760 [Polyangiales bacterium]